MWLGIVDCLLGNTPRRRRGAPSALLSAPSVEVLELRALPSCLDPGTYLSPGDPLGEFGPTTLKVNAENEDGDTIAFLTNDDFNVRLKVICKRNGKIVLKAESTKGGTKGKVTIEELSDGSLVYESFLHRPDILATKSGTFTKVD